MNLSFSMHMMTDGTMWWQCCLNQLRGQAAVVKKLNGLRSEVQMEKILIKGEYIRFWFLYKKN
jgi:hypothetical protein